MLNSATLLREVVSSQCAPGDEVRCIQSACEMLLFPIAILNLAWPWIANRKSSRIAGRVLLWLLLSLSLVLIRSPYILAGELNPDEGQELAEALTLLQDFRPWRAVDGHTHGFLVPVSLLVLKVFGLTLDHAGARLLGVGIVLVVAAVTGRLARRFLGEAPSVVAATVTALSLGCVNHPDLLAFNAEYVGLFLGAVAGAVLIQLTEHEQPRRRLKVVVAAALIALLPFAKLQVTPLALLLAVLLAAVVWRTGGNDRKRELLLIVASGCLTVVLVLGCIGAGGGLEHFVDCYIKDNLSYANSTEWAPGAWIGFADLVPSLLGIVPCGVALIAGALASAASRSNAARIPLSTWLAMLAVTIVLVFCAYRPHREFHHYLNLLAFPGAALVGLLASQAVATTAQPIVAAAALLVVFVAAPAHVLRWAPNTIPTPPFSADEHRTASVIAQFSQPWEKIAVWGWMCRYYVLAQRASATRHPLSEHELRAGPALEKYRAEYMEDLRQNDPPVFVDAVGPLSFGYTDRAQLGHEVFPALARFVSSAYELVEELGGVRIYVKRNRLTAFSALRIASGIETPYCLDPIARGEGEHVSLRKCSLSGAPKAWKLARVGGFYQLTSETGALCITAGGGMLDEGAAVLWTPCRVEETAQLWAIVAKERGANIVSKRNRECLSARRSKQNVVVTRCRQWKSEIWRTTVAIGS